MRSLMIKMMMMMIFFWDGNGVDEMDDEQDDN